MTDSAEILIEELRGQTPWKVSVGVGSMLTLEFGKKDPRQSGTNIHGEWHLWLYSCSWRIESEHEVILACEDGRDRIRKVLRDMSWTEVQSIILRRPSLDLELEFRSYRLKTFAQNSSEDHETEQWVLFTPKLIAVSARGDQLCLEKSASNR